VVEHYLDTVGVGSSILPAPTRMAAVYGGRDGGGTRRIGGSRSRSEVRGPLGRVTRLGGSVLSSGGSPEVSPALWSGADGSIESPPCAELIGLFAWPRQ
jgi:hypothetical protein